MINFRKFTRGFIITSMLGLSVAGLQAIKIGHLDYKILSEEERTVDVAWGEKENSTIVVDTLHIPSTVSINGKEYKVTEIREEGFPSYLTIKDWVYFPPTLKRINRYGILGLEKLSRIEFNEGLEYIGDYALPNSKIKECILPHSLKEIGSHAFDTPDSLDNLVIPSGVSIGFMGFAYYGGKNLTFESGPTRLDDYAFVLSKNLEYLEIPSGVTLDRETFAGADNLKKVILHDGMVFSGSINFGDPEAWYYDMNYVIDTIINLARHPKPTYSQFTEYTYEYSRLYVLPEAIEEYRATKPWNRFRYILPMETSIKDIETEYQDPLGIKSKCEIWDMQGKQYHTDSIGLPHGLYTRRRNGKFEKILIR